jgi:hypothetical protein
MYRNRVSTSGFLYEQGFELFPLGKLESFATTLSSAKKRTAARVLVFA